MMKLALIATALLSLGFACAQKTLPETVKADAIEQPSPANKTAQGRSLIDLHDFIENGPGSSSPSNKLKGKHLGIGPGIGGYGNNYYSLKHESSSSPYHSKTVTKVESHQSGGHHGGYFAPPHRYGNYHVKSHASGYGGPIGFGGGYSKGFSKGYGYSKGGGIGFGSYGHGSGYGSGHKYGGFGYKKPAYGYHKATNAITGGHSGYFGGAHKYGGSSYKSGHSYGGFGYKKPIVVQTYKPPIALPQVSYKPGTAFGKHVGGHFGAGAGYKYGSGFKHGSAFGGAFGHGHGIHGPSIVKPVAKPIIKPKPLPPHCECRDVADCRDVSHLARSLFGEEYDEADYHCLPGHVVCCNNAKFEKEGGHHSAAIIKPKPVIKPPYEVSTEKCGIQGLNPLARVLDVDKPGRHSEADFGEYPWMAAILKEDHSYVCGATIINDQAVLTAAHCVNKLKDQDLYVRLGEFDTTTTDELPYQEYLAKEVIIHGDFHSGTLANDIAVLILAEPIKFNSYIKPACLPPPHDYSKGYKCTVTGWGKNQPGGNYARILKEVDVPVVENGYCEKEYRKSSELGPYFNLDKSFMCAGTPGKDACYGDGGSPLVCEVDGYWRLVGIVAWGIGCGEYPGVYADVTKFVPWVYDVLEKYHL